MIDLQYFANEINRVLGTKDFAVYLNTNKRPETTEKTVVTLSAMRVPFGFTTEQLDAESVSVTLTFDLSVKSSKRDIVLNIIKNKLLGWKSFYFSVPSEKEAAEKEATDNYVVETFFEQQPPSNPYLDNGGITQQIVVSGNALFKADSCGAIVGNNIVVKLDGNELLKVNRTVNMQTGTDNNVVLSSDSIVPEVNILSRSSTFQITCIYRGTEIDNKLLTIAEGVAYDENEPHIYEVEYRNGVSIKNKVKILSVSVSDSAVTFLQYSVNLQLIANVIETVEN